MAVPGSGFRASGFRLLTWLCPSAIIRAVTNVEETGFRPLLLEIGTEEMPPSFLSPAVQELERRIRSLLAEHEIRADPGAELFYTPRRLAVRLSRVAVERPARTTELQGPPARVAFGPDGKPTKTAAGFARSQGRTVENLYTRSTPKGDYVFVRKQEPALLTAALLAEKLPELVSSLPFPKTMRWQGNLRFARPVRRLLCLFGDELLRFELAGLESSNVTLGRRGTEPVTVARAADYERLLAERQVICRPEARRSAVVSAIEGLCATVRGQPVLDPELIEETVDITENPVPILCRLEPGHLSLPAEVLVTTLKKHQRSFAVRGPDGQLLPFFIAVTDTPGCDETAVARWYEHAVDSRLRDARFYFEQDIARGLEPLVEEEKRVTWIEGIGSYHDKTGHLSALSSFLATDVPGVDAAALDRAAYLAKADLLTNMVREKEFTSLQGRMGGIYARLLGEPEEVCRAIAEQYLPLAAGDQPPRTLAGALLAVADRTDNIVATFLTGALPTGSEDPFALRRQASGMLATILKHGLDISLDRLITTALGLFRSPDPQYAGRLESFFQERLEALLTEKDIPYDIAEAVLETTWHHPVRALAAARALLEFRARPEFERLVIGQKRVANILRDQQVSGLPEPGLLAEAAERQLWQQAHAADPGIEHLMARYDIVPALELLLTLRQPIDRLFDDVLVMHEDPVLRANRLRLLLYVRSLFRKVADLSKIVIEGAEK